jgi:ribonuclease PH
MQRSDGRAADALRPVRIEPGYMSNAEGSVLITVGNTRVICAATIEPRVPPWLRGRGTGWVTAEYSMLPRATVERTQREASKGKIGGRTHEIQRLIGRALRATVDMAKLGERMVTVDCDVIGADGGTRTASITGAWVALALALRRDFDERDPRVWPLIGQIAAISVGIVDGTPVLDLPYDEDSRAEVDMNVAMTSAGGFVEVQGTAEGKPFAHAARAGRRRNPLALRVPDGRARVARHAAMTGADAIVRWRAFAGRVGAFHLTDRAMLRAQRAFTDALDRGEPSAAEIAAYVRAVRAYFAGFDRDARAQLAGVDRALERLYQRQYNLAAERGVAAKRVELVQGVIAALAELPLE